MPNFVNMPVINPLHKNKFTLHKLLAEINKQAGIWLELALEIVTAEMNIHEAHVSDIVFL